MARTDADDRSSSSNEDAIGPAWSEPWGCCFGQCDSAFSVAYREWFGYTSKQMRRWSRQWQRRRTRRDAELRRRARKEGKPIFQGCTTKDLEDAMGITAKKEEAAKKTLLHKQQREVKQLHLPRRLRSI